MAVTAADFKLLYPQFANVDDAFINLWIPKIEAKYELSRFGDTAGQDYFVEVALARQILLQDQGKRGAAGPITAHSKDGVSWSIANPGEHMSIFDEEYHRLIRNQYRGGCVI